MLKDTIKWWLFPGTNLNARLRTRFIRDRLGRAGEDGRALTVLDAGCGNGSIAYQSYLLGNNVLGVSIKDEVERNRRLFNIRQSIPESRLRFETHNLYDADELGAERFDEIICTEVMEHIKDDRAVCESFYRILKPGGTLHMCCPNAEHPYHVRYPLDPDEQGGHVRPGYTESDYRALLEPIGFRVSALAGIGGQWRHRGNEWIRQVEKMAGVGGGILAFLLVAPVSVFDASQPRVPFSLYVRATKPADAGDGLK